MHWKYSSRFVLKKLAFKEDFWTPCSGDNRKPFVSISAKVDRVVRIQKAGAACSHCYMAYVMDVYCIAYV